MLGFWVPRSPHRLMEKTPATIPVSLLWHLLPQGGQVGWLNHFLARNARKGFDVFCRCRYYGCEKSGKAPILWTYENPVQN